MSVTAQKNEFGGELAQGSTPGYITFDATTNTSSTGNPFADLLTGQIYSFGEQSQKVKYYNRYKIVEPYFQGRLPRYQSFDFEFGSPPQPIRDIQGEVPPSV